jgi:rRNA maturation protein Nop10
LRVCSLCNRLSQMEKRCPACGLLLADGGPVADYYGPYSPYMSRDSIERIADPCCIHLFYCPHCGFDTRECAPETEV